jgi:hypothetical protein
MPVLYHVPTVILSLVAAVIGAAKALYIVSKKTMRWTFACLGPQVLSFRGKLGIHVLLDPITAAFDSHMQESCVETSPASVGISTDAPVLFP